MLPPAPPRFSTMNCWPRLSVSFCASGRAIVSLPPPGGYGTTMRTGLAGYVCAAALPPKQAMTKKTTNEAPRRGVRQEFHVEDPESFLSRNLAHVRRKLRFIGDRRPQGACLDSISGHERENRRDRRDPHRRAVRVHRPSRDRRRVAHRSYNLATP